MTMRIAGRHAIDLRDPNGGRRSTYKVRKYRGHRTAIETIFTSGFQSDPPELHTRPTSPIAQRAWEEVVRKYKFALALATAFSLGAGLIHGLHAASIAACLRY